MGIFAEGKSGRRVRIALAAAWVIAAGGAPAGAQSRPASAPARGVSDGEVRSAMGKAGAYLFSRQTPEGALPDPSLKDYVGGVEALAAAALLTAGHDPNDPRLVKLLDLLNAVHPELTYTRSLRAMVYSLLPDPRSRLRLLEDVRWLQKQQQPGGGWGYGPASAMTKLRPDWTDASNTQMAVLALQQAADAGVPVAPDTWRRAEGYWRSFQNPDGGWGYQPKIGTRPPQRGASHGSMTAAGTVSCMILADATDRRGGDIQANIDAGWNWMVDNFRVDAIPKYVWLAQAGQLYYYHWCVLRLAEAGGTRTIGKADALAEIARLLVDTQTPAGSWNDSVIDTALALLCLARARAAVAINRLALDPQDNTNRRDAANLARWLSLRLGAPMTWQQLGGGSGARWTDAPLVCIHPRSGPDDLLRGAAKQLEPFIRNGGTAVIQARGGQAGHKQLVQDLLRTFPDYVEQAIAPEHHVFSLRYKVESAERPRMLGVGDGCRTRIFIFLDDVSGDWDRGHADRLPGRLALGANLLMYATGGAPPAGRFAARARPPADPPTHGSIRLARLKYNGDYGICPLAVRRLGGELARSLSLGLTETPPADPAGPIDSRLVLVWLTGSTPPKFSQIELDNIRKYVDGGGTLLIDPAGGRKEFRDAALEALKAAFGAGGVVPLAGDSDLLTGKFAGGVGADVRRLRPVGPPAANAAAATTQPGPPALWAVNRNGRVAAVLSDRGLTCSVEGNPCVENVGYATDDARKLVLNVILYAAGKRG